MIGHDGKNIGIGDTVKSCDYGTVGTVTVLGQPDKYDPKLLGVEYEANGLPYWSTADRLVVISKAMTETVK